MNKISYFFTLFFLCLSAFGQEIVTEEDGFQWQKIGSYSDGEGVSDIKGNIIIPISKGNHILYCTATSGSSLSVGYFCISKWDGKHYTETLCDIKGKPIISAPKGGSVGLSIKICQSDTLAYLYTVSEDMSQKEYYTINGKKLFKTTSWAKLDDNGNFINFDSGNPIGKSLTPEECNCSNFYVRHPQEIVKTSLGDFFATIQSKDGFQYKLLTLKSGKICGVHDMNDNTIVPVIDGAYDIDYEKGLFRCRQYGKDGKAFVYDKDGNVIISSSENFTSLLLSTNYFVGTTEVDGKKTKALFDIKGNCLIFPGKYKSIYVYNYQGEPLQFIAWDYNDGIYLFDENINIELEIHDENIEGITKKQDNLGIYYDFYTKNDKHGVMSQNGIVVIPANYDFINRRVSDKYACYEVETYRRNQKGEILKDGYYKLTNCGLAALNGEIIFPLEYDSFHFNPDVIEFTKNGLNYKVNYDFSKPEKFDTIIESGLYYLTTSSGIKINSIGYESLSFDEDRYSYIASIGKYKTFITPSGTEQTPLLNQMFCNAHGNITSNPESAISEFKSIIELDKHITNPSIISQSYNNIGCIMFERGDENEAMQCFQKAVEIMPTNQTAANNLNEILYPPVETEAEEEYISGWQIASNFLSAFASGLNAYNSTRSYGDNSENQIVRSNRKVQGNSSKKTSNASVVSKCQNERNARNTYNKYVGQLSEMNTWRNRYNDSTRRTIQTNMKSIRSKYGFTKSEWEDWDGSPI